jgi:HEAT repeat protein
MAISSDIIQKLLRLLRPLMQSESERKGYLIRSLGMNTPVLNRLLFNQPVDNFITDMLRELVTLSDTTAGKPALCALLEVIRKDVGGDVKVSIDELLQRISEELQQSPSNSSGVSSLYPHPQFQTYLENIAQKYQQWSNMYTLTDAEGKVFDVGLMVQTRQPKQREETPGEGKQEKVERLPVLEGIRKYAKNHVVLIGKPGLGKSTALQRLLWEEAQAAIQGEKRKIPVLVELRNWDTSVETLIYKFLRKHKQRVDINKIEDLLIDDELLLLMDGLNELPCDEARDKVARFRQDYPEKPMIFTTRDLGVGGSLGIDKQLEIQPLTEEQMREFVLVYLPEHGEQMLQQLGNRLRELGETPLILKMLCDVFIQKREIPKSRGDLFRQFDSTVNKLKEEKETVPVAEGLRRWKAELLQHLAFVMMQPENPQANPTDFRLLISRRQAETILEDFLKGRVEYPAQKAKEWLEGLLKHCLLESKASESEQVLIQFHHQLFQEYYAAEYLLRLLPNLSDAKLKRDYLNYLKWTESIAIALALVEDEALAVGVVRLALDVDLMLGARLAGEVKEEFQEKTVGLVLGLGVRELVKIKLLGITRSQFAFVYLERRLYDQSSSIPSGIIFELINIGGVRAINALIQALQHKDYKVRSLAACQLGDIHNQQVVDALIFALQDEEFEVRRQAVWALQNCIMWIGDLKAINPLVSALQDEESEIRSCAAYALDLSKYYISIDEAVLNIVDIYYENEEPDRDWIDEDAERYVINQVNQAAWHISLTYDCTLEAEGYDAAVSAIIKCLQNQSSYIREAAIEELGKICNDRVKDRAIDALIPFLKSKEFNKRSKTADVLGKIGNQGAIEPLISALFHDEYYIRWRIHTALANISTLKNLPQMWEIWLTDVHQTTQNLSQMLELWVTDIQDTSHIILKIQERCKFYNHEIFHSPPIKETKSTPTSSTTIINSEIVQIIEINEGDVIGKKTTET